MNHLHIVSTLLPSDPGQTSTSLSWSSCALVTICYCSRSIIISFNFNQWLQLQLWLGCVMPQEQFRKCYQRVSHAQSGVGHLQWDKLPLWFNITLSISGLPAKELSNSGIISWDLAERQYQNRVTVLVARQSIIIWCCCFVKSLVTVIKYHVHIEF